MLVNEYCVYLCIDYEQIMSFINTVGAGLNQFEFSAWNHVYNSEFCSNLVYNDEKHKYYTSYAQVVDGTVVVIGKTFKADITPVSFSGYGYLGAFVYEPIDGFWEEFSYFLCGLTYDDGLIKWEVNREGRIIGIAPISCIVNFGGRSKASYIRSLLPKGFKPVKGMLSHNEKVYEYRGKYYSFDNTSHNGGVWKVFELKGGKLKRIGTADKNLIIFKK